MPPWTLPQGQFQFTLPARGATPSAVHVQVFQSTLPARGATRFFHLERPGLRAFQSTLPARGATRVFRVGRQPFQFQSTLPARGATARASSPHTRSGVSIHAPRAGSDWKLSRTRRAGPGFNPRSPRGERRQRLRTRPCERFVSIHAPRAGSDMPTWASPTPGQPFQSTLPARGATIRRTCEFAPRECFNPRSPRGERPIGGDTPLGAILCFNPRSPRGERRHYGAGSLFEQRVSIHAPRAGSDIHHVPSIGAVASFNPRSPRGERLLPAYGSRSPSRFNPRSPRGERLGS